MVPRASHAALAVRSSGSVALEAGPAITFLTILDTSVILARSLAVIDAGLDCHARAVGVRGPVQDASVVRGFVVATLGGVIAHLFHGRRGYVCREVVDGE